MIDEYPRPVWLVNSHGEVVEVVEYTIIDYYCTRAGRTPLSLRERERDGDLSRSSV